MTEQEALRLDREDPLSALRERFDLPPGVYLCGHSLGAMPKAARAVVEGEMDDWASLAVEGHFRSRRPWFSYHEQFREPGARLVGARPGEVVMMNSLTVNLHLMLATFYRPTADRHAILIEEAAFPSDRYAVASQAAWHGYAPDEAVLQVPTGDLEDVLEREGRRIAVALFPGVQYLTGQALDLERLTAAAHRAGCVVGADLAHAAGNVPLRLHAWDVDFAVWCSYKYLNAGSGAVGGCFVHERHGRDRTLPRLAGWWGNDPRTRFRMPAEFTPREGADGWQVSNPPILSLAPLLASLRIFDEVGMEALRARSVRMTSSLLSLLDRQPRGRFEVITPRRADERGCQISLRVPGGVGPVVRALRDRGIVCDEREPDVLRAAPVPLYNTFHDIWRFAEALGESV